MTGYISEGIRFYRVAGAHCEMADADSQNAYVSVIFAAMYIESVINEAIFHDQIMTKIYEECSAKGRAAIDLDIYNETVPFLNKVRLVFEHLNAGEYTQDIEYIELSHLMTLRNFLVHLKPVGQLQGGLPERKQCRKTLTYLFKNLRIIEDPYREGVHWTDVIKTRKVAEWSLSTVTNAVAWMYRKTHDDRLGNHTFHWHRLLTSGETGVK